MTKVVNKINWNKVKGWKTFEVTESFIKSKWKNFDEYLRELERDEYFKRIYYTKNQGMDEPYYEFYVNFKYKK